MALGQAMEPRHVKEYALAGNAILTLESKATLSHHTYKVSEGNTGVTHLVGVLTGPSNTNDYDYLGTIRDNKFRHGKKSKIWTGSPSCKAFRWMWERLVVGAYDTISIAVYHLSQWPVQQVRTVTHRSG